MCHGSQHLEERVPKPWGAREATRAFEAPVWARERQEGGLVLEA